MKGVLDNFVRNKTKCFNWPQLEKKNKNLDFIFLTASFSEVDKGISAQINFYGSCEVFVSLLK
jgi:hypothetical protein